MPYTEELYHYGVLGMKWGIRRYQNADGTLTDAGRKRYLTSDGKRLSDDGKKLIAKQIGKVRARNEFKKIDVEKRKGNKLAENPVIRELAKDYADKHNKYAKLYDEHLQEILDIDKDSIHAAIRKVAEKEADTIDYGLDVPRWKDYGFKTREDGIKFFEDGHGLQRVEDFARFYATLVNPNDKIGKIGVHEKELRSLEWEATEALEKFQNEVMEQVKDDVLPSHASPEEIKQILYYASDRIRHP